MCEPIELKKSSPKTGIMELQALPFRAGEVVEVIILSRIEGKAEAAFNGEIVHMPPTGDEPGYAGDAVFGVSCLHIVKVQDRAGGWQQSRVPGAFGAPRVIQSGRGVLYWPSYRHAGL